MFNVLPVVPNVLTIAGSDSGGGAGIQADLKTFAALGAYGLSVVTALTAQNTHGVHALHLPPASFVAAQLDAVFSDIRIDAVKIGMLGNAEIVDAVALALRKYRPAVIVLDTVMLSKSGHALLDATAILALRDNLMPLSTLVTPNLPEATALLNAHRAEARAEDTAQNLVKPRQRDSAQEVVHHDAQDELGMVRQAHALRALGARTVLMKGGHLGGADSPDWLVELEGDTRLSAPRVDTPHTHGTGCTLSAAIAAIAAHHPSPEALRHVVEEAKHYLNGCLEHGHRLSVAKSDGSIGPLHHAHQWW